MLSSRVIVASTGAALALVLTSATAHADPPGNTSNDEHNAYLVCASLDWDPSINGFRAMLWNMSQTGLSDDDVVDGIAYATLYTCPWYKRVVAEWLKMPLSAT